MIYKLSSCKVQQPTENVLKPSPAHFKMKIVIFVNRFPPKHLAGTEIATYNIAKYLVKKGHEVHVLTTLDEGLLKESIEEEFYVHRILWPTIRFLGGMSFWIKSFWYLRKIKPDIVHFQSIRNIMPYFLKKLMKRPYIVWGHGSDVYSFWIFKKPISMMVLKNADAVIALTEDMKKEMKKTCSRDIFVIPNGINLENFENLSREKIRAELHIKDREKIILFVGTLRPIKGLKYLIQAMKFIKDENKNVGLMLVGDGEEREYLENLVKKFDLEKNVNFVGKVSNEKVPEYMAASDIFVLPSLSESFGIVNLEAMASGLPIVASQVGGLPDIIKDGMNGFLVEPKNPEQISKKILLLLEDKELRERISNNNKEKAKKYTWKVIVDRLENVYFRVTEKT